MRTLILLTKNISYIENLTIGSEETCSINFSQLLLEVIFLYLISPLSGITA